MNQVKEEVSGVKEGETGREVEITISGPGGSKEYKVRQGKYSVAEIKRIGHIPEAYVLDERINGVLTPLPDDGHVTIEGKEYFLGHVRDAKSS